jgi:hypothetical protein
MRVSVFFFSTHNAFRSSRADFSILLSYFVNSFDFVLYVVKKFIALGV